MWKMEPTITLVMPALAGTWWNFRTGLEFRLGLCLRKMQGSLASLFPDPGRRLVQVQVASGSPHIAMAAPEEIRGRRGMECSLRARTALWQS